MPSEDTRSHSRLQRAGWSPCLPAGIQLPQRRIQLPNRRVARKQRIEGRAASRTRASSSRSYARNSGNNVRRWRRCWRVSWTSSMLRYKTQQGVAARVPVVVDLLCAPAVQRPQDEVAVQVAEMRVLVERRQAQARALARAQIALRQPQRPGKSPGVRLRGSGRRCASASRWSGCAASASRCSSRRETGSGGARAPAE